MKIPDRFRGPALFLIMAILAILAGVIGYRLTGPMGIEERYASAVGLFSPESGGSSGFSLEGNLFLYLIILAVLFGICYYAYRQMDKKKN